MEKEKEKIWMQKLWELLNDFEDYKEKEYWYANYDWRLHEISDEEEWVERWITAFRIDESELWVEESTAVIICKGYGFCEWLVENDKIDFENMEWHWRLIWYLTDNMEKPTRDKVKEDVVIMLLSISDTPIEDLISYLK